MEERPDFSSDWNFVSAVIHIDVRNSFSSLPSLPLLLLLLLRICKKDV